MANKESQQVLRASTTLKEKVDSYLLKCLLGPALNEHP